MEDYQPNTTIWNDEPEYIDKIKRIIWYHLSEPERRLMIIYAECGSYSEVGRIIGISSSTARNQLRVIKKKIWKLL